MNIKAWAILMDGKQMAAFSNGAEGTELPHHLTAMCSSQVCLCATLTEAKLVLRSIRDSFTLGFACKKSPNNKIHQVPLAPWQISPSQRKLCRCQTEVVGLFSASPSQRSTENAKRNQCMWNSDAFPLVVLLFLQLQDTNEEEKWNLLLGWTVSWQKICLFISLFPLFYKTQAPSSQRGYLGAPWTADTSLTHAFLCFTPVFSRRVFRPSELCTHTYELSELSCK